MTTKEKNKDTLKANKVLNYIIIISIFAFSMIIPIITATSQSYIVSYGDDIAWLTWGQQHHTNILDIFNGKIGTGYRPFQNAIFFIGYNLFGSEPFYYYILDGLFLSGAMIFLYMLGKMLHSQISGIIAVLLYLFLDGTFIMISKLNFVVFSAEIFFITSAIYFSITYFNKQTKSSMILAIILSVFAFGSKEPSIVIIPAANLTYLYFNKMLRRNLIIVNLIPFIYLLTIMFYLAPEVGTVGGTGSLVERVLSNLNFYIDTEITSQFKSPILILFSILLAGYYIFRNKLRTELMLCVSWIVIGIVPLLFTKIAVQPTYLIELNLGTVLLIGIVIADRLKTNDLILGIVILVVASQLIVIPQQISNMKSYNVVISENQKTFLETTDGLNNVTTFSTVFYFSDSVRQKYGMQIPESFFKDYLCLRGMCTLQVVTNYSDAEYVILPSTLDVSIFQKEINDSKLSVIKQVKYGENYGFLLKKIT